MAIIINIEVMLAKRKMSELADKGGITMANMPECDDLPVVFQKLPPR
jgi:DNA-binding Xre family transcriptional regulator